MSLEVGQVFAGYTVLRVLGAGGISGLMLADGYRRRTTRTLRRTLKLVAAVLTSTIALAAGIAIAFLLFH